MIEITLLKALSYKDPYYQYRVRINNKTLSVQSLLILKDYEAYFEQHQTNTEIDWTSFYTYFFQIRHPYLDEKAILEYKDVLERIASTKIDRNVNDIYQSFEKQEFYEQLRSLLDRDESVENLKEKLDSYKIRTNDDLLTDVDMDLDAALDSCDRSKGLLWRCKALNEHFKGGLIQSDFGVIAGYVDSGKTSFLASELSYMAQQIGEDEKIIWLSNEGSWKSILPRVYSAALGVPMADITNHREKAKLKYSQLMKGNKNKILIQDIQGWSTNDVERLVVNCKPRLIAVDLLDHLSGYEGHADHERYGKIYQHMRQIATKYCPVLGISQLNGDGENNLFPTMSMLKGSKVDKQAASTFQLMIGSTDGDNTTRYLSMPKNKVNEHKNWRVSVKFDPVRSRFD